MASKCTAQNEPKRFKHPYSSAAVRQARTDTSFLTCEEKRRLDGCTGKAPQRVDAQIRHMHPLSEHSASSRPTCALRAPFVSHTFHFCFDLCRASEVNAHTPDERSSGNPSVLTKLPTRKQCMRGT